MPKNPPEDLRGILEGGAGQDRTVDLPLFRRTLYRLSYRAATLTGLEPATSAVTGRRANQLRHRATYKDTRWGVVCTSCKCIQRPVIVANPQVTTAFLCKGCPPILYHHERPAPLYTRKNRPTRSETIPLATLTGLEPATSAVTGRRANQLRHRAIFIFPLKGASQKRKPYSQRDSNPCCRRERAES